MRKIRLITNNPRVLLKLREKFAITFIRGNLMEVLIQSRDLIHKGYILLTHPLSGSVKPNESPYKSILIEEGTGTLDIDSLRIIENSIATAEKFVKIRKIPTWPKSILEDFSEIDYSLIKNASMAIKNG